VQLTNLITTYKRGSCESAGGAQIKSKISFQGTSFSPKFSNSAPALVCDLKYSIEMKANNPVNLPVVINVLEIPLMWQFDYPLVVGLSFNSKILHGEVTRQHLFNTGSTLPMASLTMGAPEVLPPHSEFVVGSSAGVCPPHAIVKDPDGMIQSPCEADSTYWQPWGGLDKETCCAVDRKDLCTRTFGALCNTPAMRGPLPVQEVDHRGPDGKNILATILSAQSITKCINTMTSDVQSIAQSVPSWPIASPAGGRVAVQLGRFVLKLAQPAATLPMQAMRCTMYRKDGRVAEPDEDWTDDLDLISMDMYAVCLIQC